MDGLAATRAIKQASPGTSVIMVTLHDDPDYLLQALKAGAAGYLLKNASLREVRIAVRRVLEGAWLLNPEVATALPRRLADEQSDTGAPPPERLTPREADVLRLLITGQTNRQIAANLTVSLGTVKAHVEHIIAKLGVSDRTQAAVRAIEPRILPDSSGSSAVPVKGSMGGMWRHP